MLSQMLSLSDSISVKDDAGERKSKMQKKKEGRKEYNIYDLYFQHTLIDKSSENVSENS